MAELYLDYACKAQAVISETDKRIRELIDRHSGRFTDEYLDETEDFAVFSALSELRTGILSWYEFRKEAEILEVGGEFGTLTGFLLRHAAHVTVTEASSFRAESITARFAEAENLDVYAGDVLSIPFPRKFDYIIAVGALEYACNGSREREEYSEYLKRLSALLKPEGTLLLTVENRYGIRYFCGTEEPHTGFPFDGINGYPYGTAGCSFSREEIKDIIGHAGFDHSRFYYPMPDARLPQLVYSDGHLPEQNVQERLLSYCVNHDSLIALERDLYQDIIANGVFPFFSNSFLLECSNGETGTVQYAAISTDRGRERGYATTIHQGGIVKKSCLYPEGRQNAEILYHNIMDLKAHGIPAVEHEYQDGVLTMPYIEGKTLSIYLREVIRSDKEEYCHIFDRLWQYILHSSEAADPAENALLGKETGELDWGVILKKAYIELIPLNCFWVKGEFLFFDQEFMCGNYPAKYIMFRAIHYMYGFDAGAEGIVPKKDMIVRYGLEELWDLFMEEEKRFLNSVRNHEKYRQFYRWVAVDAGKVYQKAHSLGREELVKKEYLPAPKLRRIWKVQLGILKSFIAVCEKYHLQYYMIYGTLLGAVRHQGFIPWDDDMDIAMPRQDYDRLREIAPQAFEEPFFLQTPENDPGCYYGGYARLRDSSTTGMDALGWGTGSNQGIWIDLFPIDMGDADTPRYRRGLRRLNLIQRMIFIKTYGRKRCRTEIDRDGLTNWWIPFLLSFFHTRKGLCRRFDRICRTCGDRKSGYMAILTHYKRPRKLYCEDFQKTVWLPFENLELPAPGGYDHCLKSTLGRTYMEYPPQEERKPHHAGVFLPNLPYRDFAGKCIDIFNEAQGKTIVLFGSGQMFDDYMKKHGKEYPPACIADNNKAKWGTEKMGIPIINPQKLLEIPKEKLLLILCNIYYQEIGRQVEAMGITDYRIYVQEKGYMFGDSANGMEMGT